MEQPENGPQHSHSPERDVHSPPEMQTTVPLSTGPRVPVRTLVVEVLEGPDAGQRVEADSETITVGKAHGNDLVLTDDTVSGFHLELARREDGVSVVDLESRNGTVLGDVRIERGVLPPGTVLKLGRTTIKVLDGKGAVVELHGSQELDDLRGQTPVMRRLMAQVSRVARANVPVLLIGESGTGKELVARALHDHSTRATKPFVTVDCGSLAPTLVASALFGHERGAFTGAERQHIGAFERADGGTLFLDEIGELPADLQPQLLGALERRRFMRLGGKKEISVDVRVVSATNRDLRAEVNAETFRMDLYFRVAVVVFKLPALRERSGDIPMLVEHFLKECGHPGSAEEIVPPEVMDSLRAYRWPGNVRELRNWVEATVAMGESPEPWQVGEEEKGAGNDLDDRVLSMSYKEARTAVLDRFEARYLKNLLDSAGGNVTHASRKARMDRSYLIKLLQRHGLR